MEAGAMTSTDIFVAIALLSVFAATAQVFRGGIQGTVTDESGVFEMTMLAPGTYSLAVQHEGFAPFSPDGIVIRDRRLRVRLQLMPDPHSSAAEQGSASILEFDEGKMLAPTLISGPAPEYTPEELIEQHQIPTTPLAHDPGWEKAGTAGTI